MLLAHVEYKSEGEENCRPSSFVCVNWSLKKKETEEKE